MSDTIQFIPQRRFYDTATVAETHRRLLAEGHNISENALRGLIRQGCSSCGQNWPQVAAVLPERHQTADRGQQPCFVG